MKIRYYIMVILLLLVSIPTTSNVRADDIATIYGVVKLDGNNVENAEIKLENLELSYIVIVFTDENGEYEGELGVRAHNEIKVTATVNSTIFRSVTFTRSSDIHEYEVNFLFGESGNGNGNGNGIIRDSFVYITVSSFLGDLWAFLISLTMVDCLLFLLILLVLCILFRLLFPKKPKRKQRTQQQDNDTIILLTGNGKVKKLR